MFVPYMCLHWTKRVIREFFAILLFVSIEAVPFVVQWHIQIFDTGSCYARKKYICHNKQWSVLVNWVSRCEFSLHCCHTTQLFGNFAIDWPPIYVSNCTSFTWFIFRATFCLIIHIKCCPAGQYNYNRAFQHTHTHSQYIQYGTIPTGGEGGLLFYSPVVLVVVTPLWANIGPIMVFTNQQMEKNAIIWLVFFFSRIITLLNHFTIIYFELRFRSLQNWWCA